MFSVGNCVHLLAGCHSKILGTIVKYFLSIPTKPLRWFATSIHCHLRKFCVSFFFSFFFSFWDPCQWLCGFLFPWAFDFSLCPGLCFPKAAAYSLCFHNHFAELEQILYFLAFTSPLQWQQFGNGPKLSLSHSYFNDLFIYFSLQTSQTSSEGSGDKDRKRSQDRGLEKWQYPWCG